MEKVLQWLVNNTDLCMAITSICAVVLSIVAIIVSIYTVKSQNKFNKDSVMPVCSIVIGDYENDIFVQIKNIGVGVLRVVEMKCVNHATNEVGNVLYEMLPLVNQVWEDFTGDIQGRYIGAGDDLFLVKINPVDSKTRRALREILKDMEIEIKYENIYKDEFFCSRKLNFFGRLV